MRHEGEEHKYGPSDKKKKTRKKLSVRCGEMNKSAFAKKQNKTKGHKPNPRY